MATAEMLQDGLMTVAEACAHTSLSRTKLYEMMDSGELPFRVIHKLRRLPRKAVMDFIAAEFDCEVDDA